jgi:hypothetical protein
VLREEEREGRSWKSVASPGSCELLWAQCRTVGGFAPTGLCGHRVAAVRAQGAGSLSSWGPLDVGRRISKCVRAEDAGAGDSAPSAGPLEVAHKGPLNSSTARAGELGEGRWPLGVEEREPAWRSH